MTESQFEWSIMAGSPAKVNLTLRVLGPRDDGFTEIQSLVLGVGLSDTLRFRETNDGQIRLTCSDPAIPSDDGNLVVRAAKRLAEAAGTKKGVQIDLEKRIPTGAGMGGGSGNAAVTLSALNQLWRTRLRDFELARLGAEIGSDVPLFFKLPASVIRGRGEKVEQVRLAWSGWVVLVLGGMFVSTKETYGAWHGTRPDSEELEQAEQAILSATTAEEILPQLRNDLEEPVFRVVPEVKLFFEKIKELGARHARISGAGSTVFTLYDTQEEAESFASVVREAVPDVEVVVVKTLNHVD